MAMKKKLSKSDKIARAIIALSIIFALAIAFIASNLSGNGFRLDVFFYVFIPTAITLSIIVLIFNTATVKGKIGEAKVSRVLKSIQKKYGGYIINDVIIPDISNPDNTSQLDHVYISTHGVYVIETKNYAGMIFGKEESDKWTQTLAYGKTKNSFYNPVKQNKTHVYRLEKLLNIRNIYSLVVFIQADISNVCASNVITLRSLKKILKHMCSLYSDITSEEVEKYYLTLNEYKSKPITTTKEHVKHIKIQSKNIDKNICPRCGAKLVLRKSSKTGKEFYGCSNYPKCKFIK